MTTQILVAGIGNIFMGDDAFGCEVAGDLAMRGMGEGVLVRDFGICSYDLAYAMTEGYEVVIMVDAVRRGEAPGTVFLIEVSPSDIEQLAGPPDAHGMNPATALQLAQALGGETQRLFVVGCEPAVLEADAIGLSDTVRNAVPEAIRMVEELVQELTRESHTGNETPACALPKSCGN